MTSQTVELRDPAFGELIGEWRESSPEQVAQAIDDALAGSEVISKMSRWERCDLLLATSEALRRRRTVVIEDLMLEHGKVRSEAEAEVDTAIHSLEMNAEYARRLDGTIPEVSDPRKRVLITRIPLGVVGVVTPWNFPINIPVEYIAPALAMGNSVVWKGAETTQLSSRHLNECFVEAGWPAGVLTLIEGGPATGADLVRRPELAAACFTGSTSVGNEIASVGGTRRLLLELGGNGPSVVLKDANLLKAAKAIVAAVTACSGQSCAATERVLVDERVRHDFLDAIDEVAAGHRVGKPDGEETTFGPLHLAQTGETMREHVADAVAGGANLVSGGDHEADRPTDRYWPLTVLTNVQPDARVMVEETFGPILPITTFRSDSDLQAVIEASPYGLSAAVFTQDIDRAFNVSNNLQAGTVTINDRSDTWETHVPFGGYPGKTSGVGRVGGAYAMQELSTVRTLVVDIEPPGEGSR